MEEQQHLSPLTVTHLLQHTLRSLCIQDSSQWVYAVFWRILPRNYPPPKWDLQGGVYDRTRGNRRNWILVWEDGFCNFVASSSPCVDQAATEPAPSSASRGLQPELFFKMSHEIYNYGEGLIGKVAADHSHKWVFEEPSDQDINFLSSWNNPAVSQPRTWEAQFQSGIKTIALIAVGEGVVQLGSVNKVMEDLGSMILVREKFAYLESIPGVLLPHPSSSASGVGIDGYGMQPQENWPSPLQMAVASAATPMEMYDQYLLHHHHQQQQAAMRINPSMSSLEALLSKLPAVAPGEPIPSSSIGYYEYPYAAPTRPAVAKEEVDREEYGDSRSPTIMPM